MTAADGPLLLTGGAGYIGSHVAHAAVARGRPVVALDNLSTGARELLPGGVELELGDVADVDFTRSVMRRHGIGAIIHLAGSIVAPESVKAPLDYYRNNVGGFMGLLDAAVAEGVETVIFSSTAAVYRPQPDPIGEDGPLAPTTPYGRSKLACEWMLEDAAAAHGLHYASLRYFNVAGADPEGRTGQIGELATHLIRNVCRCLVGGQGRLQIFGDDYDTPDGTCIRDYVHVTDLAEAHLLVLDHLLAGGASTTLNCGYGRGCSVRQVVEAAERVAGRPIPVEMAPRRSGDAPCLVASPARLTDSIGWRPAHRDLDEIIATALAWETRRAADAGGPA